jgi:branched-chain amino acid transport system permease protein
MLETIIVSGTIAGLFYAFIALGFNLIYGVSGMVNMAHGVLVMIGAYIYGLLFLMYFPDWRAIPDWKIPDPSIPFLIIILSCIIVMVIGTAFYRLALHYILGNEVSILIASICGCIIIGRALNIYLAQAGFAMYNTQLFSLHPPINPEWTRISIPGIYTTSERVSTSTILAVEVALACFAILAVFITKTKTGRAMKALSQDLEAAILMGINAEKLFMLTTALSSFFACLAGIFYFSSLVGLSGSVAPWSWLECLGYSFAVVILGGLGSLKGTVLSGLIIGYVQYYLLNARIISTDLGNAVPFAIIALMLLIRPKGLFGKRVEME